MLLVDSIFSDYTAACLSVYQLHSKSLSFCEVSSVVQNQYTVRALCYLTSDTSMAPPLRSLTLCGRKNSPCPRAGFRRGLRGQVPWGTLAFFWLQLTSFSVLDLSTGPLWFTTPGGLQHPMPQQTWPDLSHSSGTASFCQLPAQHYQC